MPLEKSNSYSDILESYNSMTPSIDKEEQQKITQKTISDLREDKKFLENAEVALGWLGDNINKGSEITGFGSLNAKSDPIEAIRDSQWNTAGLSSLAWNINDAPDDVKKAWAYIRKEYAEADTRGLKENAEALFDIGVDIVSDPVTLGALISIPFTGGTSTAGALTTRAGLTAATRTALGKFAGLASGEMTKSAVKNGVIGGTMYGALESHSRQNTDLALGLQDKYSLMDLGLTTATGGAFGGAGAKYIPQAAGGAYRLTKDFFENKPKDKVIDKIGDNVDPSYRSEGDPEAEELAAETANTWKQNNAVPRNFRDQVMNKYDLTPEEADDILTSIFEIKSKDKQTPEDTKVINEIKDSFDLDTNDIDDITNDYSIWLSNESEKVPQGFIDSFVNKWTPFKNAAELNNNRDLTEGAVEEKIQFILNTGGRKKITQQEQEALDDILDEFDLTADDYTEILDDVAVYKIDNPTPQAQANRKLAEETSEKAGLGEKTTDEIEGLLDGASKDPELRRFLPRKLSELVHRGAGNLYMGRPMSRFKAYINESPRLKELANSFRYDTTYKDLFSTSPTVNRVGKDFYETFSTIRAGWSSRIHTILDSAAFNYHGALSAHNQKIIVNSFRGAKVKDVDFENQDKSFRLNPFINDRLLNQDTTNTIVTELKGLFDEIGTELLNRGIISKKEKNYFPRMWDAVAISKNQDKFANLLMEDMGVSQNDANRIINNMLEEGEGDSVLVNPNRSHFFYNRKLDIQDESKFSDFLEQDLQYVLLNYADVASRAIAKQDIFGVKVYSSPLENVKTFQKEWVNPIRAELESSGISKGEVERVTTNLKNVWEHLTGEGVTPVGRGVRKAQDIWTIMGRTALLPLITITSLTEPFINIAKAGPKNTAYGFVDSLGTVTKTIGVNFANKLAREYKYKVPEVWGELEKVGSTMNTAMSQMSQRTGDRNMKGVVGQLNYHFFRGVLIDQWTKFVQLVSHNTAKRVIAENLTMLHDAGVTRPQSKLKNNTLQTKQAELLELDIDIEQGINWVKNGSDTKDAYWQEGVLKNVPRYVREVIVPTEKAAGVVPVLHNNPQIGFLFDLLSYPAAFSNTVLADFYGKAIRNKSAKVTANSLAAFMIMTEVARFGNYVRSRGESEKYKDEADITLDAIKRHGGYGPIEPIVRGLDAWRYSGNITNISTALVGPTGSDITRILQRGTIAEALGQTRVPGIQGLRTISPELFEAYKERLQSFDETIKEGRPGLTPQYTRGYAKGGIVYDVPQAPEEPDERVDKMTGLPYDVQAGEAFVDEEERDVRKEFAKGSSVKKHRVLSSLTKLRGTA